MSIKTVHKHLLTKSTVGEPEWIKWKEYMIRTRIFNLVFLVASMYKLVLRSLHTLYPLCSRRWQMCKIWSRKDKICLSLNIWFVLLFVVIVLAILGTVLGALPIGIPPNDERIYTVFVHRIYKVFINLETIP